VAHGVRRVIVGVSGSSGSLHALRRAVAEARCQQAVVYSVLTWTPQGGELANKRVPRERVSRCWEDYAGRRLRAAWDDALGGIPPDLDVCLHAVRGPAGQHLVRLADREDDLLVLGAGSGGTLRRLLHGSVARYCALHARCCVLIVPPTSLQRTLGRRPLARRRMIRHLSGHRAFP
jgi:nucleotide-binding universal stress UspA family protein